MVALRGREFPAGLEKKPSRAQAKNSTASEQAQRRAGSHHACPPPSRAPTDNIDMSPLIPATIFMCFILPRPYDIRRGRAWLDILLVLLYHPHRYQRCFYDSFLSFVSF